MLTRKQEMELIEKRNKLISKEWFVYDCRKLFYAIVFALTLVFFASVNAYMVYPTSGHLVSVDITIYIGIAFIGFICLYNIYWYKVEAEYNTKAIEEYYNNPINKSNAAKLSLKIAYGVDIVDLDEIDTDARIPRLDDESEYDWMYD